MSRKRTSLVTGGAGFIGSHVASYLLKMGQRVVILDDLSGGSISNIPKGAVFVNGSINDSGVVEPIFDMCRFDYVYHLAAYAAEGLSHFVRKFNYENNLMGSINLINQSIKFEVKHFVFTSSIAVYGTNQLPMIETLIPNPEDPYGIAKLAVEKDLESAHKMFGLTYTVFRPHNVFGERQNLGDPYRNVIGIFINKCLKGEPMQIFGDGRQTRAFSYIDDVAPYIAKSAEVKEACNEIINIGADHPYSVKAIAGIVAELMGSKTKIRFVKGRQETKHAYSDHAKGKRIFNITKTTDFRSGLSRMIDWARQKDQLFTSKVPEIEVVKNLPTAWRVK